MNDPIDRLGEAFGDVAVPDQWPEITRRAAGSEVPRVVAAPMKSAGRPWSVFAAAAAVIALVVAGIVVISQTGDRTTPLTPADTIAPPATNPSDGDADPVDVADELSCAGDADLETAAALVRDGAIQIDVEPASEFPALVARTHGMVAADVVSIERSDGFTRLLLADPVVLDGRESFDSVSVRSGWDESTDPDPLETPIDVVGLRAVAFATSISSAPEWIADPEGLFIGCADDSTPAVSMLATAPAFFDTTSIGALEAQITESLGESTGEPPVTTAPEPQALVTVTESVDDSELSAIVNRVADPACRQIGRWNAGGGAEGFASSAEALQGAIESLEASPEVPDSDRPIPTSGWTELSIDGVQSVFVHPGRDSEYAVNVLLTPPDTARWMMAWAYVCSDTTDPTMPPDGESAPWTSPCTELESVVLEGEMTSSTDEPSWDEFAPLGAEPAMTIALPFPEAPNGHSGAMFRVHRVEGGLMLVANSGTASPTASIVSVVNHDGSVRWRRCFDEGVWVAAGTGEGAAWALVGIGAPYVWHIVDLADGTSSQSLSSVLDGHELISNASDDRQEALFLLSDLPDGGNGENTALLVVNLTEFGVAEVALPEQLAELADPAIEVTVHAHDDRFVYAMSDPQRFQATDRLYTGNWTDDPATIDSFLDPYVLFDFDNDQMLTGFSASGEVLWTQPSVGADFLETYHVSDVQQRAGRSVVLVNGCVDGGAVVDEEFGSCRPVLHGLDASTGEVLWRHAEPRGVSYTDDGYAIVTRPFDETSTTLPGYEFIDLFTGEPVTGAPSWDDPAAFDQQCCGGGDYYFVGGSGGVVWTVSNDRVLVWYPNGSTGSTRATINVDLLGGSDD